MNNSTKYYAYKVSDDVLVGTNLDREEVIECVRKWATEGEVIEYKEENDLTTFGVRAYNVGYVACVDCHTHYDFGEVMDQGGLCHCGNDMNRYKSVEDDSMIDIEKLEQHIVETAVVTNVIKTVTIMSADLVRNGLSHKDALAVATWFVDNYDDLGDIELNDLAMMVDGEEVPVELDRLVVIEVLKMAGYLTEDLNKDIRFAEVCAQDTKAYFPALATEGVTRRFEPKMKTSTLYNDAIAALEATEYTVDSFMLKVCKAVDAKIDNPVEGYVIAGCDQMKPELGYVSEFKPDDRGRIYQAACHGPNGQSSDRSRALMDLKGVPQDYDNAEMLVVLKAEIMDMVSCKKGEVNSFIKLAYDNPVQFILNNHEEIKKPYAFVKAAKIYVGLVNGEKPYLGLATGLDAKCSGPQLGALMVGDGKLAEACGFTTEDGFEDAYHRAVVKLTEAGFTGFDRASVKKPFMGIFYGQAAGAFSVDPTEMYMWAAIEDTKNRKDLLHTTAQCIYGDMWDVEHDEDIAKAFHDAVSSAFGYKLQKLRYDMLSYREKISKAIKYKMPDGFEVAMNYKVKVNVFGEEITRETQNEIPTVLIQSGMTMVKLEKYSADTDIEHYDDYVRNGFVNMIQATDALLARLIIANAKELGVQHIISVHDCFRVNMTEMPILVEAIKRAYKELFGSTTNKPTARLPEGSDILSLYFKGANKSVADRDEWLSKSQFNVKTGVRNKFNVAGMSLEDSINLLPATQFFAK